MGALPALGQWVRWRCPQRRWGSRAHVNGMAYTLYGGRATWDRAGKAAAGAPPTYQLSGTIRLGSSPLSAVSVSATGGVTCTASNTSGVYSCSVPQGWSGTVTPALAGYTFTPASRSYSSVAANQSAQDYAAAALATGTDTVWVDDAFPTGAAMGGDGWTWVSSNPAPYSGARAYQSALRAGRIKLLRQRQRHAKHWGGRDVVCVRVPGPGESAQRADAAVERRQLGAPRLLGGESDCGGQRWQREPALHGGLASAGAVGTSGGARSAGGARRAHAQGHGLHPVRGARHVGSGREGDALAEMQ